MGSPAARAPAQVAPPRMTLASIHTGRRETPDRVMLYGVEAVGKSTFAAESPSPIFIAAEDGVAHLDVASFPALRTFGDALEAVRTLTNEQHNYRTLVIDTLDWLEPLIWQDLCRRENWENIESPGYGKGYNVTADEWRKLIVDLEKLQAVKRMDVILLAHAHIKPFSNPGGQDFSRYEPKLHKLAAAIWKEWVKVVLFGTFEEFAVKERGALKAKGTSTGRRVAKTERTAAYDAKNRCDLPPELPLSYAAYVEARDAHRPADPSRLIAEAVALLAEWAPPAETRTKATDTIEKATGNAAQLAKIVDTLRSRVSEKGN